MNNLEKLREAALRAKENWTLENDFALIGAVTPDVILELFKKVDELESIHNIMDEVSKEFANA